jgi:hypothetical protein
VLRSYDNRACYTERRPDVYLKSDLAGPTKIVCDVRSAVGRPEPSDDRDFGTYPKDSDTLAWLWKKDRANSSRLLVIATPYREGRHYATSPRDFVPVVEHLERLHAAGYVHGDIRCFNMALGPREGGLIDFDLGGKLANGDGANTDVLRYPYGYNHAISDGSRLGRAGMPITKYHDAYALTKAIFACHVFLPGNIKGKPRLRRLLDALFTRGVQDLVTKENELSKFGAPSEEYEQLPAAELEEKISTHMAELKKFLKGASSQQWIVHPQPDFRLELVEHGFYDAPGDGSPRRPAGPAGSGAAGNGSTRSPAGSGAATGSPSKKLPKS